jgi:hypothetical protein
LTFDHDGVECNGMTLRLTSSSTKPCLITVLYETRCGGRDLPTLRAIRIRIRRRIMYRMYGVEGYINPWLSPGEEITVRLCGC